MAKTIRVWVVLIAISSVLFTPAVAGQWGVVTEFGLSQFTQLDDVEGSAFGLSIGGEYWPVEALALEVRYLNASHEYSDSFLGNIRSQIGNIDLDKDLNLWALLFGIKGALYEDENFHFWGGVSVGDYVRKIDGRIENADVSLRFQDVGIETAVGIDYIMPSSISIGFATRYTFILDDGNAQHLGVFLRFGYFFGRKS